MIILLVIVTLISLYLTYKNDFNFLFVQFLSKNFTDKQRKHFVKKLLTEEEKCTILMALRSQENFYYIKLDKESNYDMDWIDILDNEYYK